MLYFRTIIFLKALWTFYTFAITVNNIGMNETTSTENKANNLVKIHIYRVNKCRQEQQI